MNRVYGERVSAATWGGRARMRRTAEAIDAERRRRKLTRVLTLLAGALLLSAAPAVLAAPHKAASNRTTRRLSRSGRPDRRRRQQPGHRGGPRGGPLPGADPARRQGDLQPRHRRHPCLRPCGDDDSRRHGDLCGRGGARRPVPGRSGARLLSPAAGQCHRGGQLGRASQRNGQHLPSGPPHPLQHLRPRRLAHAADLLDRGADHRRGPKPEHHLLPARDHPGEGHTGPEASVLLARGPDRPTRLGFPHTEDRILQAARLEL